VIFKLTLFGLCMKRESMKRFTNEMRVNEKIYQISEKFDRETSQRLIIDLFNKPFEDHQRTHRM
jgi:hypothetical protein